MELSHQRSGQPYGLLYPLMLIAAVAVIVFSILGIASIAGWMPGALAASNTASRHVGTEAVNRTVSVAAPTGLAFNCVERGMVEIVRAVERGGPALGVRVAREAGSRL